MSKRLHERYRHKKTGLITEPGDRSHALRGNGDQGAARPPDGYCELRSEPMLGSLNKRVSASLNTSLTSLVLVS